ncbi:hypothetical protein CBM2637_B60018 [Cupriavidus taiwanensis]|nr:hypothetical protein CBM2637_B60018 [Cupriavidus taiwanensis]
MPSPAWSVAGGAGVLKDARANLCLAIPICEKLIVETRDTPFASLTQSFPYRCGVCKEPP